MFVIAHTPVCRFENCMWRYEHVMCFFLFHFQYSFHSSAIVYIKFSIVNFWGAMVIKPLRESIMKPKHLNFSTIEYKFKMLQINLLKTFITYLYIFNNAKCFDKLIWTAFVFRADLLLLFQKMSAILIEVKFIELKQSIYIVFALFHIKSRTKP